MGRRKIEIKAIKDERNRSVTFLKRKSGLFKKAHELSVLCSADVMVIVFGANKKLYEYSSGSVQDTLGKYQYYGPAHEHKGPADFSGKPDLDDEDDDDPSPPPEDLPPQAPQHSSHAIPHPQMHNQPAFQHINHTPSASPPVTHGLPYRPQNSTPQPRAVSRPPSRNNAPPMPHNAAPQQPHHSPPPPPPPPPAAQNGYAYVSHASLYNQPVNSHQPHPASQYQYPPQPAVTQQQQQPPPQAQPQPQPPMGVPLQPHHQHPPPPAGPPHQQQQQHQPAPPPPPPPQQQLPPDQHAQHQTAAHAAQHGVVQDPNRRQSLPPAFHQPERSGSRSDQPQPTSHPEVPEPKQEAPQSPPPPKRLPTKSRSIFTPIDDQRSVLAQHLVLGRPTESPKAETPSSKQESRDVDVSTTLPPPPFPAHSDSARSVPHPQRTQSVGSIPDGKGVSRTNSLQAGRPQLRVQIPSEHSDAGSGSPESTPKDGKPPNMTPVKGNSEAGPSPAVVLPPPSPSANALLSAGASGPPNPFARPPPPSTGPQNNSGAFNSNGINNNNNSSNANSETPMSALPSRLVSDALLPSPSGFYSDWSFGRSGPDSNMLPSPLAFPTPVQQQNGSGFSKESEEVDKKRKSSESVGYTTESAGLGKRLKTDV